MENPGDNLPINPFTSASYNLSKSIAVTLSDQEIERLKNDLQYEMDRRFRELARQKYKEDHAIEFAAWREKRHARDHRKFEERSERMRWKRCGSATESDSDKSYEGFEYHVEDVDTNEEDSDVVEEKKRMMAYHEGRLYRRYQHERANPEIFARTVQEGESTDDNTEQLEDETDDSEDSDVSDSYDEGSVSHASPGSDYSEQYEEEENWSYDGEDY